MKDNSLIKKHPEVAKHWDKKKNKGVSLKDITCGSDKKFYWKCPVCGKEECCKVYDKIKKYKIGSLCTCHNKNLLIKKYPEVAKHWKHDKNKEISIKNVTCGSGTKAYWLCPVCGKEDCCRVQHKVRKYKTGTICTCNSKNLLIKKHPEVARHWDKKKNKGISSNNVTCGSGTKAYWLCPVCGKEDYCAVRAKVAKYKTGTLCTCHNKNLLIKKHPQVAKHWDHDKNKEISLKNVTYGSDKKFYWKCPVCGKEGYCAVRYKVVKYKTGTLCTCHNKNLLIKKHPEIAKHWDHDKNKGISLKNVTCGSGIKAYWKCPVCGKEDCCRVQHKVRKHTNKNKRCSYCNGDKKTLIQKLLMDLGFSYNFISKYYN